MGDDEDAEGWRASGPRLERPEKDDEVLLFLGCQPDAEHQVEEFHRALNLLLLIRHAG